MGRYGGAAIGSISDDGVKVAAKRWGKLPDGKHQLFEHTVLKDRSRIAGLEQRAGLPSGTFTDVFGSDPTKIAKAVKAVDDYATKVIQTGAKKIEGTKTHYWAPHSTSPSKGTRVIEWNGKRQSIGPMKKSQWDNFNP